MKRILYLFSLVLLSSGVLFSQGLVKKADADNFISHSAKKAVKYSGIEKTQGVDEYLSLSMNQQALKEVFETPFKDLYIENFPVTTTEKANIILKRSYGIFDAQTKWTVATKNGVVESPAPKIMFFEGSIEGEEGSRVFVSYFRNTLTAAIEHKDGINYNITPDLENSALAEKGVHKLFAQTLINFPDMDVYNPCATDDHAEGNHAEEHKHKYENLDQIQKTSLLVVPVLVEGSSDYLEGLFGGNLEASQAYIASVMALASKIYQDQINVTFKLVEVKIWTIDDDPYQDIDDIGDKLQAMPDSWDRPDGRALSVLFTKQISSSGLFVGGIAMGGTPGEGNLCNTRRGYCVLGIQRDLAYPNFNYTWDVSVAAHEMGHVFGGPHTHSCYWAPKLIDTCVNKQMIADACYSVPVVPRPGTIMSYCHLTNQTRSVGLFFHDRDRPLIRQGAVGKSCVTTPETSVIYILNPLGRNKFSSGDNIDIRWTFHNVSKVNIYYSTNNGGEWTRIATDWNAADTVYKYQLPAAGSTQALIKIANAADENIYDVSLISFTVELSGYQINEPVAGERIGMHMEKTIRWSQSSSITRSNLEYSIDGGQNWNSITQNVAGTSFKWEIPDIESENVQIRITSATNASISALSPVFSIGQEKASFIYPSKSTDSLCNGTPTNPNIHYTTDYLEKIDMWLSMDNGQNWKKVTFAGAAITVKTNNPYLLKLTSDTTKEAILKITVDEFEDIELARTEPFTIYACAVSVEDNGAVKIEEIAPNPASTKVSVKFELNNAYSSPATIKIVDMLGAVISEKNLETSASGLTSTDIDVSGLAIGNYYILISNGNETIAEPLKIAR